MKLMHTSDWTALFAALLLAGCNVTDENKKPVTAIRAPSADSPREIVLTPNSIPGTPRSENDAPTGGYAPSSVQTQLKVDVRDGTREVHVIRDSADPYVVTKPYVLKNADPYAVRSYLEAAVGAKSVSSSPAEVTAVKYKDGTGVVLVSAEAYRFSDSQDGKGIDAIVAALDRKDLAYLPDAETRIYFPKISRAANLRDMLLKVGSSSLDPQFAVKPGEIMVDAELNALVVKAPSWNWNDMRAMLAKYDRQIPEVKISYRVLEIYAENDDRIGIDFQSWKNNEGVDFFSAGTLVRRNWGTFFASGVQPTDNNRTSYWNFNPKWNTRYLDFLTSIGKAKCVASGAIVARNRMPSRVQVNTGFFYDRTSYKAGYTSLADATNEFVYADPNPDTIQREAITKVMPSGELQQLYREAGSAAILQPMGYTLRMMGIHTGTNTWGDVSAVAYGDNNKTDPLAKYLTGYVKLNSDGTTTSVPATWYNTPREMAVNTMNSAPGIIHGGLQYPMVTDGFKFDLSATPVVTGKAAKLDVALNSISLLGWNSDGSARMSKSAVSTTVQIGYEAKTFVIGGLKKSESVRGTAGLPFFKDLPVIGRVFSTETESIKQSQLVLIAEVECFDAGAAAGADVRDHMGKIIKNVNTGMTSRVGNMFFQQYGLDDDRPDRETRLDDIHSKINDESKGYR